MPDRTITIQYCPEQSPDCLDGLTPPNKKGEYTSFQGLAIDDEGALYLSDKGMNQFYKSFPHERLDPAFKLRDTDQGTRFILFVVALTELAMYRTLEV